MLNSQYLARIEIVKPHCLVRLITAARLLVVIGRAKNRPAVSGWLA